MARLYPRIWMVMIAVAGVAAWLALSRLGPGFGVMALGVMQGVCLIQLHKRHGVDPANGLTAKERRRLLLAELTLLVVFVPLFVVTVAISRR